MSFHDDKILVDFHGCALRKIIGSPVLKAQCETKGAQHMLYMYMGKERKIPLSKSKALGTSGYC